MNKKEQAAFEKAWVRFKRRWAVLVKKEIAVDFVPDKIVFEAGWRARTRAQDRHVKAALMEKHAKKWLGGL